MIICRCFVLSVLVSPLPCETFYVPVLQVLITRLFSAEPDSLELFVEQYNVGLRELLDLHAPLRTKVIRIRPSAPWINDEVRQSRKVPRKAERVWRATGLTVHYEIPRERHRCFKRLLVYTKSSFLKAKVGDCGLDSRKLFQHVGGLMGATTDRPLPTTHPPSSLPGAFCDFFSDKIVSIRSGLDASSASQPPLFDDEPPFLSRFQDPTPLCSFSPLSTEQVVALINAAPAKSCSLDLY